MPKKSQAVQIVEVPEGTPEAPPIHELYAEYLRLIPRLRYPIPEAAWLLAMSIRQLGYRVEAGEIQPVFEGDKHPLFTIQELKRYAVTNHASRPHPGKKQVQVKENPRRS